MDKYMAYFCGVGVTGRRKTKNYHKSRGIYDIPEDSFNKG